MTPNSDRLMAAMRACNMHYLTAIQDDVRLAHYQSEPYLAARGNAYMAVLDYLLGDSKWWEQPTPTLPEIAWCVVSEILPDSGPEPITHMVDAARTRLLDQRADF